jgi:hypothetical protein
MEIQSLNCLQGRDYAKISFGPADLTWIYQHVCFQDKKLKIKFRTPIMSHPDCWGIYNDAKGQRTIPGKILSIHKEGMTPYLIHDIDSKSGSSGMHIVNREGHTIAIHKGVHDKEKKLNIAVLVDTPLGAIMTSNLPLAKTQAMILN